MHVKRPFKEFIISRVRRLIIPYYFFCLYPLAKIILKLISPAAFASFHGKPTSGPWQELLNIFFGKAFGLWFLFALFLGGFNGSARRFAHLGSCPSMGR